MSKYDVLLRIFIARKNGVLNRCANVVIHKFCGVNVLETEVIQHVLCEIGERVQSALVVVTIVVEDAETLKTELDEIAASTNEKEKRYKELNELLKKHAMTQFRDGDKKVEVKGSTYTWTVARSETTSVDKDALKADGLLDKYLKATETYRLTVK